MAGWKLESTRFLILVTFPVASFWMFNQAGVFNYFLKGYKLPDTSEGDAKMKAFKDEIMERRRREQEERLLREQMDFEEARRTREKLGI
ncbi:Protein Y53F4B.14 a [Aphelenchoides avenae]|nr:Protein Y53F4B.14 a [Aphelenchus avenae]